MTQQGEVANGFHAAARRGGKFQELLYSGHKNKSKFLREVRRQRYQKYRLSTCRGRAAPGMERSCQSIGTGVLYPPIIMRKKHIVQPSRRNTEKVDDCDLKATDGKAPKTQYCADVVFRAQLTIDLRQTATRVQLAPPSR